MIEHEQNQAQAEKLSNAFFAVQRARAIVRLVHDNMPDAEDTELMETLDFSMNAAEDQLQIATRILADLHEEATA